jgi:hypothetical protein
VLVAFVGAASAACAACAAPQPSQSGAPTTNEISGILLPSSVVWPVPPASPQPCAGVGLDATLRGDPSDPAITWLEDRATGARIAVTWPAGFRARFVPALEVMDLTGRVVHREADLIDGACVDGDGLVLGYP